MPGRAVPPRAGRRGRSARLALLCAAWGAAPGLVPDAAAQLALPAGGPDPILLPGPTAEWPRAGAGAGTGGRPNLGPWLAPLDAFAPPPGRGPAGAPPPAWLFSPSLSAQAGVTNRSGGGRDGTEYFGLLSPTMALQADTAMLSGRLSYSPRARFSTEDEQGNRISHIYAGQALATLVPDLLFVDVRGSGDVRSIFGTAGLEDDVTLDRRETVQGSRYQVSPYILQRFGGLATARAGYTFRQSVESGSSATLPGQALPFFTAQDLVSHEGFAVLRSGEDWGRLAFEARTVNTVFDGSGIYQDAHRYIHNLQTRYALTREVAVLLEGGWEDQRFNGVRPFSVQGATWGVGLRFMPDPDSSLTVRYGQRDGRTSFSADGSLALGVRTTLVASYSERLSSSALQEADLLSSVAVDAYGNLVDTATGLPAALGSGNPLAARQSNLFRLRRAVVSVRQAWPRDTLILSAFQEERTPLAIAAGTSAFAQESTSVGLTWSRSLSPTLNASLSGRYGLTSSAQAGESTTYLLQLSLAQSLSPTLSGTLTARTSVRETENLSGRPVQNTVILGLRQLF